MESSSNAASLLEIKSSVTTGFMEASMKIPSIKDVVSDVPFKLLVGPDHKAFYISVGVFAGVASSSRVLRVLITEKLREGLADRVATWDDIDEKTFRILCEVAYTGKYSIFEPGKPPPRIPGRPGTHLAKMAYGVTGDSHDRPTLLEMSNIPSPGPNLAREFLSTYMGMLAGDRMASQYGLLRTHEAEDRSERILQHIRMYILGAKYDIRGLLALSLFNLLQDLANFKDTWDDVPNLAEVVRLVYGNIPEGDGMRDLIAMYFACKIQDLDHHPAMKFVRSEYPAFTSDLLSFVIRRLDRPIV